MTADAEEQEDELLALRSIFDSEEFVREESEFAGRIRVSVELPAGFTALLKDGETLRQYEISFLPPLLLTFELPEDYPSSSPPSFTLTCSWLTHTQLSALRTQLADLHLATGGAVVLFSWVQFLKEDALRFLDIHTVLELPSDADADAALSEPKNNQHTPESGPSENQCDVSEPSTSDWTSDTEGAVPLVPLHQSGQGAASLPLRPGESPQHGDHALSGLSLTPSQALLSQLLIYDAAQNQKAFASTVFDCGVCFTGWLGSACVQLSECGHIFCQTCLSEYCKLQITEGNVRGVTCPQADCPATPTPAQVKSLVGEELFSRYDRLLLQNTLDCMPDVTYCPRRSCGSAVIQEKSSTAAMCTVCSFAFCVTCRKTYHGADDCQGKKNTNEPKDAQQAHVDLPQSQEGIKALWDDYASASTQRQHLLESRYGRSVLQVTVEECLSEDWIAVNSKNCPHCFCRIQKDRGCNTMMCSQCRRQFCWACLARLQRAGDHFVDSPCSRY